MEVRYNQEPEPGMGLKNGIKDGKDGKDSQGNLSKTFLKDQQESFSPSGTVESCEKNRGSTGDPDYCRRILVRGERISTHIYSCCSVWTLFAHCFTLYVSTGWNKIICYVRYAELPDGCFGYGILVLALCRLKKHRNSFWFHRHTATLSPTKCSVCILYVQYIWAIGSQTFFNH